MKINSFVVSELRDLRVMQRVFREAKFCAESDDDEISDSPIVAELFSNLMAVLIEADAQANGEVARKRWEKWLMIDDSRAEWSAALMRARASASWTKWTDVEKREYVTTLLSPFVLSEATAKQFIDEVTSAE